MDDITREIAFYNALPCTFDGFLDADTMTDGVVTLVCVSRDPANPEKELVPQYIFDVCVDGARVGGLGLRIGYHRKLYFGGHIGYGIDEANRGNGYAGRACRLAFGLAKRHGMERLLISNASTNDASRRVCEKLGARLLRVAPVPEWHDLHRDGHSHENIFEIIL